MLLGLLAIAGAVWVPVVFLSEVLHDPTPPDSSARFLVSLGILGVLAATWGEAMLTMACLPHAALKQLYLSLGLAPDDPGPVVLFLLVLASVLLGVILAAAALFSASGRAALRALVVEAAAGFAVWCGCQAAALALAALCAWHAWGLGATA